MNPNPSDCLPSSKGNKYFQMWRETDGTTDEKRTAVFIEALTEFTYTPVSRPRFPQGFEEEHNTYLNIKDLREKSDGWKYLRGKYPGYFKAIDDVISENMSNLHFLKEAKEQFQKLGMTAYVARTEQKIMAH